MKINIRDYNNIWFLGDPHIGHDKSFLFEPRGCTNRDEHSEMIIDGINKQAGENDLILSVGDWCLTTPYTEFIDYMNRINCKNIYSVLGNHDNRFIRLINELQQLKRDEDDLPYYIGSPDVYGGVIELYQTKDIRSLGKLEDITIQIPSNEVGKKDWKYHITLNHFPMLLWDKSHYCAWNIHGHCHGSLPESSVDYLDAKRLDVGVDSALEYSNGEHIMFSWCDIKRIMSYKTVTNLDHHNSKTN